MNKLEYRKGCLIEAFKNGDVDHIAHGVNCQGVMASGIAKQIKEEFPRVFERYGHRIGYYTGVNRHALGGSQIVHVGENKFVINLFIQEFYGRSGGRYVNYAAIVTSFTRMLNSFLQNEIIGIPKIGAGLGGGDWDIISTLIEETMYLTEFKGKVVVYEL